MFESRHIREVVLCTQKDKSLFLKHHLNCSHLKELKYVLFFPSVPLSHKYCLDWNAWNFFF